ncbi:MAG: peroxiredoxin family protein, partial [Dehalococcoidia bacterium]
AQRGKTVLLYFHEGLMCAPCWQQVGDIQADLAEFTSLGVDEVVAISVDPLASQTQHARQVGVSIPALADEDKAVSGAYDALSYGMMGGSLPGHTFVLVGPDGVIRWRADYGGPPDYTMYVPNPTLLAELRGAFGS